MIHDREIQRQIMATSDPREQKALGRKVRGFDPAMWDKAGFEVVVEGNLAKFRQNPHFKSQLLATGDRVRVSAVVVVRFSVVGLCGGHLLDRLGVDLPPSVGDVCGPFSPLASRRDAVSLVEKDPGSNPATIVVFSSSAFSTRTSAVYASSPLKKLFPGKPRLLV